ncbi:MAG: baseplate hub protein [Waterburya sp.]
MIFRDVEFVFPVVPKETLNITFSTKISETQVGAETRIPQKVEPIFSYSFDSLKLDRFEVAQIRDFYKSCRGSVDTFKYRSTVDCKIAYLGEFYQEENSPILILSYGKMFYNATLNAWQTVKVWEIKEAALAQVESRKTYKTIRHPDLATLKVFVNGLEVFNWNSLGYGVFQFLGVSFNGSESITFECEYLSEVRFKEGALNIAQSGYQTYTLSGLEFTEEVNNSIGGYSISDFTNSQWQMLLPFTPIDDTRLQFPTRYESLDNFRDNRQLILNSFKGEAVIESNSITEKEKNLLLTWFMVAKGRCLDFIYNLYLTRFDSDTLSISSLVQEGCKYYEYGDIPLRQYQDDIDLYADYAIVGYISGIPTPGSHSSVSYNASLQLFNNLVEYFTSIRMQRGIVEPIEVFQDNSVDNDRWLRRCVERGGFPPNKKVAIFIFSQNSEEYLNSNAGDYTPTPAFLEDLAYFNDNANPSDRYILVQHYDVPNNPAELTFKHPEQYKLLMHGGLNYTPTNQAGRFSFAGYKDSALISVEDFRIALATYHSSFQSIKPLAFCLKITKNGISKGFTSLDMDFIVEGTLFKSKSAIEPSATQTEINLSTDNLDIKALIDNGDITDQQLISGYWDDALVQLVLFNFVELPPTFDDGIPLLQGRVGRVTLTDIAYTFELRSLSEILNRPIAKKTSPKCDHTFGGIKCGKDLLAANLRFPNAEVVSIVNSNTIELNTTVLPIDFVFGAIEVKSGANTGILLEIISVDPLLPQVQFNGELAEDFQIGDTVDITAFCKKDQYACKAYNNFVRFGGIPVGGNFVPGLNRITVTP